MPTFKLLQTYGSGNSFLEIKSGDDIFLKPIKLTAKQSNLDFSHTDSLNVTIEFANLQLSADTSLVEFKFSDYHSLVLKKTDDEHKIFLKDQFFYYPIFPMGIPNIVTKLRIEIKYQNNAFPDVKLFDGRNNEEISTSIGLAFKTNQNLHCEEVQDNKSKVNFKNWQLKDIFKSLQLQDIVTTPSFISSGGNVISVTKFEIKKIRSNISPQHKTYPPAQTNRFGNEKYLALLIGSNKYGGDPRGLTDLYGVQEDYEKIKQKLIQLKYELTELKPLDLNNKDILSGHKKSDVLRVIKQFEKKLDSIKEPTKVVVYFVGHGYMKSTGEIQCFALDNDKQNSEGWDLLNQNDFLNIAKKCTEFILISDACRPVTRGEPINISKHKSETAKTSEKPNNSISKKKAVLLLAALDDAFTTDITNVENNIYTLSHSISEFLDKEISLLDLRNEIKFKKRVCRIQLFSENTYKDQEDWSDFYFNKLSNSNK
jgi:hypothetical protein